MKVWVIMSNHDREDPIVAIYSKKDDACLHHRLAAPFYGCRVVSGVVQDNCDDMIAMSKCREEEIRIEELMKNKNKGEEI